MNFYPHHIGDYAKDTAHLSMVEDGAYRRLLDIYYTRERPLPGDPKAIYRLARAHTKVERDAINAVLQEFFVEENFLFRHHRCEKEIENAQSRISAAQKNGAKGGRPRKQGLHGDEQGTERNPLGLDSEPAGFSVGYENATQQKAHQSQKPITNPNNQSQQYARAPLSANPPTFDAVLSFFEKHPNAPGGWATDEEAKSFFDYYDARGWIGRDSELYSLESLVSSWMNKVGEF